MPVKMMVAVGVCASERGSEVRARPRSAVCTAITRGPPLGHGNFEVQHASCGNRDARRTATVTSSTSDTAPNPQPAVISILPWSASVAAQAEAKAKLPCMDIRNTDDMYEARVRPLACVLQGDNCDICNWDPIRAFSESEHIGPPSPQAISWPQHGTDSHLRSPWCLRKHGYAFGSVIEMLVV
jgi:hypothetical protein